MKTLEEKIAVMQAALEGKEIQIRHTASNDSPWRDDPYLYWNWLYYDYRVKPEEPKPEYVPYENQKEFFQDILKHKGWVIDTKESFDEECAIYYAIDSFGCEGCTMFNGDKVDSPHNDITYDELLETFIWADDQTRCGKLINK